MRYSSIVFRADGSNEIGLGHIIRSLSLADMLKEDFDCVFAIHNPLDSLNKLIESTCKKVIHLPSSKGDDQLFYDELDSYLSGNEIVVLDGYRFNTSYQESIKRKGSPFVCIDDIHAYHFVADIVINHAVGFDSNSYSGENYTRFFFGPAYALLRKEFLEGAKTRSLTFLKNEILVCLGGADPSNQTLSVIRKLQLKSLHDNFIINVVIGAAYNHHEELFSYLKGNASGKVNIFQNINARQMVELMRSAKIAICSPSTVTFEYLSVSEGQLFLVYLADNQKEFYKHLISKKIAIDFFDSFEDSVPDQSELTSIKKLLDGNQGQRYLKLFHELANK